MNKKKMLKGIPVTIAALGLLSGCGSGSVASSLGTKSAYNAAEGERMSKIEPCDK